MAIFFFFFLLLALFSLSQFEGEKGDRHEPAMWNFYFQIAAARKRTCEFFGEKKVWNRWAFRVSLSLLSAV